MQSMLESIAQNRHIFPIRSLFTCRKHFHLGLIFNVALHLGQQSVCLIFYLLINIQMVCIWNTPPPGIPVDVQAFVDGIDRISMLIASQIKNIKIHFEVKLEYCLRRLRVSTAFGFHIDVVYFFLLLHVEYNFRVYILNGTANGLGRSQTTASKISSICFTLPGNKNLRF